MKNFSVNLFAVLLSLVFVYSFAFLGGPISKVEAASVCANTDNLVVNGSFESPIVSPAWYWDIYSSGVAGWNVEWVNNAQATTTYQETAGDPIITRPVPKLEIQRLGFINSANYFAASGTQWAELDSDWDGPSPSSQTGEPSSTKIYQDIPTVPGNIYTFSFSFAARPDSPEATNILIASWAGGSATTTTTAVTPTTVWTTYTYEVTATASTTRIEFSDGGIGNSRGVYLDDVKVNCKSDSAIGAATLTVIKNVINNDGGIAVPENFTMLVTGTNVSTTTFPGSASGTVVTLNPGSYSVDEVASAFYIKSFSADCVGSIGAGENKTCIVTNDDMATSTPPPQIFPCADFNNDGIVTEADVDIAKANSGNTPATFADGDVDGNGIVNATDISITKSQLGRVCRAGGGGGGSIIIGSSGQGGVRGMVLGASIDPLICVAPNQQQIVTNQSLTYTVSGGTGGYMFMTPNNFVITSQINNSITGYYTNLSNTNVMVSSGGETVTCVGIDGQVLGEATELPEYRGELPGMPSTGSGVNVLTVFAILFSIIFVTIELFLSFARSLTWSIRRSKLKSKNATA
jgi:hypothetical protein